MDYSGPASVAEVEADLTMSDDDNGTEQWPPLDTLRHPPHSAAASTKQGMDQNCDVASGALTSPATKTVPLLPTVNAPAFAPKNDYIKLAFKENSSSEVKLRWLNDVTKAFHLDRDLAEVKMSAVTSRFVYISRCRNDIVRH